MIGKVKLTMYLESKKKNSIFVFLRKKINSAIQAFRQNKRKEKKVNNRPRKDHSCFVLEVKVFL